MSVNKINAYVPANSSPSKSMPKIHLSKTDKFDCNIPPKKQKTSAIIASAGALALAGVSTILCIKYKNRLKMPDEIQNLGRTLSRQSKELFNNACYYRYEKSQKVIKEGRNLYNETRELLSKRNSLAGSDIIKFKDNIVEIFSEKGKLLKRSTIFAEGYLSIEDFSSKRPKGYLFEDGCLSKYLENFSKKPNGALKADECIEFSINRDGHLYVRQFFKKVIKSDERIKAQECFTTAISNNRSAYFCDCIIDKDNKIKAKKHFSYYDKNTYADKYFENYELTSERIFSRDVLKIENGETTHYFRDLEFTKDGKKSFKTQYHFPQERQSQQEPAGKAITII